MASILNPPTGRDDAWAVPTAALTTATLTRSPAGRVIAVIVNFNGRRFLEASIGSALAALAVLGDHQGDLLLVDNASTDGSRDYIRERFPRVAVLHMSENTGGSGGFSAGMRVALTCPQCEFVWLLDNDILIEAGALDPLLTRLDKEPRCGAVGSQICLYDRPQIVQEVGGRVTPWLGALRQYGSGGPRVPGDTGAVAADYLAACSVLIRRACLEEVGPFRDFFVYYDDVDWGLRARAAGWQLRAEPASVVCHWFSGMKPLDPWREYYRKRNRAVLLALHPPRRLGLAALWVYLCYLNHLVFWYSRLLDNALGDVYRQALADCAAGRLGRARLPAARGHDIDLGQAGRPEAFHLWLRRQGECRAAADLLHARWPTARLGFAGGCADTGADIQAPAEPPPHPLRRVLEGAVLVFGYGNRARTGQPPARRAGAAGQGAPVVVVDDRFPLAALRPGSITWQYLAGELRLLRRPFLTWLLLRLGLIIAVGDGLIRGTRQFPGVARRIREGHRDGRSDAG